MGRGNTSDFSNPKPVINPVISTYAGVIYFFKSEPRSGSEAERKSDPDPHQIKIKSRSASVYANPTTA